jgi:hypothetical protein
VSGAASRRPAPAVDHHDRWPRAGSLLDVGVERQVSGVGNIAFDTGDDVVAVGIADVERGARLREGRTRAQRKCDKDRNERNRQPAGAPAVGEGVYGCRTASANAVTTCSALKLQ